MINQPLYGRRIVITRPEAKALAEELERLGAEVTIVPLIEIHPAEGRGLEEAVESLASYDWIVLTSVNGVAALVDAGAATLRRLQTGSVRTYASSLFLGVVLVLGYYLWR